MSYREKPSVDIPDHSAGQPARNGRSVRFSIVMPTYNRRDVVLQSIAELRYLDMPWPCELIVVVDGSTDGTEKALQAVSLPFSKRILWQENAGAAAARNRGAAGALGEFILFLDDDMAADRRLLVEHERLLAAGADAVVGHIPMHPASPPTVLTYGVDRWARARRRRLLRSDGRLTVADLLSGQVSMRASTFARLGGFDTGFTAGGSFGGEDTDFLYRLLQSGARVRFAADAVSYQRYVVSPEAHLRQWTQAGQADAALSRKHPGLGDLLFAQHGGKTIRGSLTRAAAAAPPWASRVPAGLVLGRVSAGKVDRPTRWMFLGLRDCSYWRGTHQRGGLLHAPDVGLRILAYHAIEDVSDPLLSRYAVPPPQFRAQLTALLGAGFTFVGVDELLHHLDGRPARHQSLVLTFDDAYSSLFEHAVPVLRELGIPATVFVVTKEIGGWNRWDAVNGAARLPLLDASRLRALHQEGWEVAAHSRTHGQLTRMSGAGLWDDLSAARGDLAAIGLPVPRLFAYPYGEHDARVRMMVKKAGYDAAFALQTRRAFPTAQDRYALPRIEVERHTRVDALVETVRRSQVYRRPDIRPDIERELGGALRRVLPVQRTIRGHTKDHEAEDHEARSVG
ncbi:hypothetical protein ThrDRAFT_01961 [Frankia casuarinae]|nr:MULTISPECIES: polysaccharide deacetylase family protein [Frankia]ETA02185.1 hypothetical protein CcI6DRAFT_02360 [Frankia sp. CcI6]EYT92351.1 hypothetical protein ThrDRAFT_01961 [Frankia casuarinae]KDA42868.1 hypothetical protein BMG523Draft_02257 [Frankia sp. BMG5.23]OHV57789.1 hypothetical protein CgIS1_01285 [Frankia sp. CgIS1]